MEPKSAIQSLIELLFFSIIKFLYASVFAVFISFVFALIYYFIFKKNNSKFVIFVFFISSIFIYNFIFPRIQHSADIFSLLKNLLIDTHSENSKLSKTDFTIGEIDKSSWKLQTFDQFEGMKFYVPNNFKISNNLVDTLSNQISYDGGICPQLIVNKEIGLNTTELQQNTIQSNKKYKKELIKINNKTYITYVKPTTVISDDQLLPGSRNWYIPNGQKVYKFEFCLNEINEEDVKIIDSITFN